MNKKNKKKNIHSIAIICLVALLSVSTYLSLVVMGVVVDENKKSAQNNGNETTAVYEDNTNSFNAADAVLPGVSVQGNQVVVVPSEQDNSVNNTEPFTNANNNQTSSQSKVTAADVVKVYAQVMNNAKAKAPAFTKIEYQELPDGPNDRVFYEGGDSAGDEAVAKMLTFVQNLGVFVPKDEAEKNPFVHEKGDADMSKFPVFDREKGSYLTDPEGIESYTMQVLPNGNVKLTFVLVPEDNPEPVSENSNKAPSYTGAVFSPMSKERIDGTVYHPIVTIFAKNIEYSLRYHDCYVEVEFDPSTLEIKNLKQIARVSIKGSGDVVGLGHIGLERQELISTVIIKDISY